MNNIKMLWAMMVLKAAMKFNLPPKLVNKLRWTIKD